MTDQDVDAIAWQFLNSDYATETYMGWSLDRRIEGFLRHCGLTRIADDGDGYNLVLERVMSYISAATDRPRNCNEN